MPSHSAAGAVARDLEAMAERTGETRRRTTRRPRGCSKHAFAPSAQFHPRIKPAGNVTLPAQRHNRAHPRAQFASGTSVAGNDPVNVVDPLGLWGWNPISDATQAWNDTGGKAASYVAKHHQIIEQVATVAVVGLATAACIAATDGLCAAALPLIGAATNTAVYEEGGGQHTLAGAAQAFGEGGLVGSLALVCVAACEIAGGILAGGALVNGLVGAGQGIWDYSQSTGCHSATGYAKAGADGFGQGAIPWDSIWKGIAGGGGDG